MRQDIPSNVQQLLSALAENLKSLLGSRLIGIYIHGSLAMGGFTFQRSDIDILIVVQDSLSVETKREIIRELFKISSQAPEKGLELSIITLDAVRNFDYPTLYELHFSNAWKERYLKDEVNLEIDRYDPDLAAHFMITFHRGFCLVGEPIKEVFMEIPDLYYRESILADAHDCIDHITANPIYSILNLCRVLAYITDKRITSKLEGAEWGLTHISLKYHLLIQQALAIYQDQNMEPTHWDDIALQDFAHYMKSRIFESTLRII
jgi:predicted nucleotidyltransferase